MKKAAVMSLAILIVAGLGIGIAAYAGLFGSKAQASGLSVDEAMRIVEAFEGRRMPDLRHNDNPFEEEWRREKYIEFLCGEATIYRVGRYTGVVEQAMYGENIESGSVCISEEEALDIASVFLRERYPAHERLTLVDSSLTSSSYCLEWAEVVNGVHTPHRAAITVNPSTGAIQTYGVVPMEVEGCKTAPSIDEATAVERAWAAHSLKSDSHLEVVVSQLRVVYLRQAEKLVLAWEVRLLETTSEGASAGFVHWIDARTGEIIPMS